MFCIKMWIIINDILSNQVINYYSIEMKNRLVHFGKFTTLTHKPENWLKHTKILCICIPGFKLP